MVSSLLVHISTPATKGEANKNLQLLTREHKEEITIPAHNKLKKGEVVEQILAKAPAIKIGDNSFDEAIVEVEGVNIFRKIYLALKKLLNQVDYCREEVFNETVCGVLLIITIRAIALK